MRVRVRVGGESGLGRKLDASVLCRSRSGGQSIHQLSIALQQDLIGLQQAARPIQELAALGPPV